ncbi:hypothetical protein [Candidatus Babela massiliensis]|uniref:Uncharacterized protein n=1 Tax=Candidatus Babela massiliensis TaxID=673862 RepID=V6DGY7_9BACT|nr:hypothetical protein [Candidatus Babela massiliensis]CDK30825.1 hypothetical protein BABL1_gene_190 [Candidatus Babela massiliensis]
MKKNIVRIFLTVTILISNAALKSMDCPRVLLEEQGYTENYDIEKGYNYREYVDPLYQELSDSEYASDNEFNIGNVDDEVIIRILDTDEKSDEFSQIQEQESESNNLQGYNPFLESEAYVNEEVLEANNRTLLNPADIWTPFSDEIQPINTQSNLSQEMYTVSKQYSLVGDGILCTDEYENFKAKRALILAAARARQNNQANLVANYVYSSPNCKIESRNKIQLSDSLPDDIVSPSRWQDNPTNPDPVKINGRHLDRTLPDHIRKRQFYRPALVKDRQALIVFIAVHGTWQQNSEIFHKDIDKNDKKLKGLVYNHIKKLAAFYATSKEKNLELLSLRWNGELGEGGRTDAGHFLKELICETPGYRNSELVFLGHSHGCNIINEFTNRIEKPIDIYLIYFGCPRRTESKYQPKHYKVLLYFHSDSDFFTVAGRDHMKALKWLALPGLGGIATGALSGFYLGGPAGAVGGGVVGLATGGTIAMVQFNERMGGDNHFSEVDDAITVGFRTKFNAWNASHGGLLQAIQFLPKILDKLVDNYRLNYIESANFHLNVDTQCDSSKEDPVTLVIFKKLKCNENIPPAKTDIISLKTPELEYERDPLILKRDQKRTEDSCSEKDHEAYKKKYKPILTLIRKTIDIKDNFKEELSMK